MPEAQESTARAFRIFVSYSHRQSKFVHTGVFADFLQGLANSEHVRIWTDRAIDRSEWNEQIQQELQDADMIVCVLSQSFLNSRYIRRVEMAIAKLRHKAEGLAVIPILYSRCMWDKNRFLSQLQHLPSDGTYIEEKRLKTPVAHEIVTDIERRIRKLRSGIPGAPRLFREPRSLYTLRRLLDRSLTVEERRRLKEDSCRRAESLVHERFQREKICSEARRLLRKAGGRALPKEQLRNIDRKVLALGHRRPDPYRIRWVLRCVDLHPQGSNKDGSWRWLRR